MAPETQVEQAIEEPEAEEPTDFPPRRPKRRPRSDSDDDEDFPPGGPAPSSEIVDLFQQYKNAGAKAVVPVKRVGDENAGSATPLKAAGRSGILLGTAGQDLLGQYRKEKQEEEEGEETGEIPIPASSSAVPVNLPGVPDDFPDF